MDAPEERLIGLWLRSPEDDDDAGEPFSGAQVYRPFSHPFPPARAPRPRLVLAAGGGLTVNGPAPADAPSSLPGRWHLDGDLLVLESAGITGRFRFRVDPDRLVLQAEQQGEQ